MCSESSLKILIVDDNEFDREIYRRYLSNEFSILEATSASDALNTCRTEAIDLILLDFLLPDSDGLALLGEIKTIFGLLHPPIVMMTGQGSESIAVRALKQGAEDYLVKSQVTAEILKNAVRRAIENAQLKCDLAQTQQQLHESQRYIHRLTEAIPGILYIYDLAEERNVYINRQITDLLGFTPEEVREMGSDVLPKLVHPEDFDRVPLHLSQFQTARDDQVFEFEYRMQNAQGDWCWFHTQEVVFRRSPNGTPDQILGIAQQIMQRKQVELSLARSNERFELAAEAIGSLIYEVDFTTGRVERTRGLFNVVGYLPEEAEPTVQWWQNLIHPDDLASIDEAALIEQLKTVDRFQHQYRVRHKQGHYVWVHDQTVIVRDENRQPIRMVGNTTDISDRIGAIQEQERLFAEAETARAEAEAANRSKDEFLAIVSHELRSPLNSILGWAKLLQARTYDAETVSRALSTIERNAQAQSQLIEDLLDISRMIRGNLRISLAPVDLAPIVETAIANVQLAADAKEISLRLLHRVELPQTIAVIGDSDRLQQVVTNLLTNAVKFTPNGGSIVVLLGIAIDNPSIVEVAIRDTGKGIAPEFLPHVFDRFAQAESDSSRSKNGLGLGLAISRHLVELHNGTIYAESPGVNQGATFTVRLPLIQP